MSGYLAVLTALVAIAVPAAQAPMAQAKPLDGTPAARHGCDKSYTYKQAARGLRKALRHHYPMSQAMGARGWHYVRCARSRTHVRWLTNRHRQLRDWRRSYRHVWPIRLNALPATWIQWARNITACESGWNRYASNGSHFSYFQWASSTWAAASRGFGAPASPYNASWEHQAVIAIHWAKVAGTSQWVCKG